MSILLTENSEWDTLIVSSVQVIGEKRKGENGGFTSWDSGLSVPLFTITLLLLLLSFCQLKEDDDEDINSPSCALNLCLFIHIYLSNSTSLFHATCGDHCTTVPPTVAIIIIIMTAVVFVITTITTITISVNNNSILITLTKKSRHLLRIEINKQ